MSLNSLPVELKNEIISYLPVDALCNLSLLSNSWINIIQHPSSSSINPIRRDLVELYRRLGKSKIWPAIQSDIVTPYLSNKKGFDREAYLSKYKDSNIGDEFRQWVLEWPAHAPIGWLWPDLGDDVHQKLDEPWWAYFGANLLVYPLDPEQVDVVDIPKNHPLKKLSSEERAAQGWGKLTSDSHSENGEATLAVCKKDIQEVGVNCWSTTYIFTDGAGPYNGTVWRNNEHGEDRYGIFDEDKVGYIGTWIEFLHQELSFLERYAQAVSKKDRKSMEAERVVASPYVVAREIVCIKPY